MIGLRRALGATALAALLLLAIQIDLLATAGFAPDHGLWIALDVVIGVGFIGVGLFAWYRRPENRVGTLMVATGFAWFVTVFSRTEPALLFTVGFLLNNLFVAPAIHLLLAFPSGRLGSRFDRLLVAFSYVVVTVGFLPAIFAFDPRAEGCACPSNLFLIQSDAGFVRTWFDLLDIVGLLVLGAVIVRLVARWRAASPPLRRIVAPLFVAGALLMAMLGALLALDLLRIEHDEAAFYVALIPFALVPYLFLASLARARMLRGGAVGELVSRIGVTLGGGGLRDALARALNVPSLDLAFWLPDAGHYVDSEGRRYELPGPGAGRATSDVTLDGERVAVLVHDPLLLDDPDLIDAVGAAAALALERDRLEAELRAKVDELRESRSRLISIGLAERRRLERDLHDGAQQRLVSLALDLRLARRAAREDPDRTEELLDGAGQELERALGELRELARGLHPAVLSDRGLDSAVDTLAGRAPLPVEIVGRLGDRAPESVELAAYFVVAEALTNVARYAQASRVEVRVDRDNGSVVVEVADDGVGGADPRQGSGLRGLADRISTLGGRLEVESVRGEGTKVVARIPCE